MDVKEKTIHEAISGIDDKFIEEAAEMGEEKNVIRFRHSKRTVAYFVSAAASIALIILGGNALRMSTVNGPAVTSDNTEFSNNAVTMQEYSVDTEVMDEASAPEGEESMEITAADAVEGEEGVSAGIPQNDSAAIEKYSSPESKEAQEEAICVPARGFAMASFVPKADDESRYSYKVILYGLFDESEIKDGATGYYDSGYGELSMCNDYEEILNAEAERLTGLGIDASIYVACGEGEPEYGLTVNLSGMEVENFPCSDQYGYTLRLTE